jgi:hypothetical protein
VLVLVDDDDLNEALLLGYLFRYQGYVQAALVLGGVDATGPHLHTVSWVPFTNT